VAPYASFDFSSACAQVSSELVSAVVLDTYLRHAALHERR
jgi:hypothetical protein